MNDTNQVGTENARTPRKGLRTVAIALVAGGAMVAGGLALAHEGAEAMRGMRDGSMGRGMGAMGGMRGMGGMRDGDMDGPRGMRGMGSMRGMRDGRGGPLGVIGAPLGRLGLGTEVTVETFDADPSDGAAAALSTATLIVGETSESAFAAEVMTAAESAAYLRVSTGPSTVRIDLPSGEEGATYGGRRGGMLLQGLDVGQLADGATITVAFHASTESVEPSTVLSFTEGTDSMIGFRAAVMAAMHDAAAVEVTMPATERIVDLAAMRAHRLERGEAAPGGAMGPGRRGMPGTPGMPGMPRTPGMHHDDATTGDQG